MLAPASDDPHRKEELKRRDSDPEAFGTDTYAKPPKDWNPHGGLVADKTTGTKTSGKK